MGIGLTQTVVKWVKQSTSCNIESKLNKMSRVDIPVQMALRVTRKANGSNVFLDGRIIAVHRNGVVIERNQCMQCTGYESCAVAEGCLFDPYSSNKLRAMSITLYARVSGRNSITRFLGKVSGISKAGSKEYIRFECGAATAKRIAGDFRVEIK